MSRKITVEGELKLKMEDSKLKKNIDALKKIDSELTVKSNIEDVKSDVSELKTTDASIDFNSNLNTILKDIQDIENVSSHLNIDDAELSQLKKNFQDIKNTNINAKAKVDKSEWELLKKEWSDKYTISAVASVAGGMVGGNEAEQYNDLMTMLRERGLTKEQAQELIAVGREQGLKNDELKDAVLYSNKDTLDILTSNDETTKQLLALMAAAERSGQSGADDISRMISAMEQSGATNDEILRVSNAMVGEIQNGNTEVAEAIREHMPDLKGQMTAEEYASILMQMNLPSSEDVSYMGDTLADLSLYSKQNGKNTDDLLNSIKNAKSDKELQEIAKNTKMDYEKINRLHEYLQRVDMNKGLENSTDKLNELVDINEDQRGIIEKWTDGIGSWMADTGLSQYAGEMGAVAGGVGSVASTTVSVVAGSSLKDLLTGKLKIKEIQLPKNLKLPKINMPDIKLPNLSSLKNIAPYIKNIKGLGRAFGVLGIAIMPVAELLDGDIKGALAWLGTGLLLAVSSVGTLASAFTILGGELLHLTGFADDGGFTIFESGIMALMAVLTSFAGFITGDWSVSSEYLIQSFEALGLSTEEATALAEQEIAKWQAFPQNIIEWFSELPTDIATIFDETYSTIKTAWDNLANDAYTWGSHFLDNLINGIKSKIAEYTGLIQDLAGKAKEYLGHTTPDKGPMKDDDKWGQHFMQNITGGIKKELPNLQRNINATTNIMSSANPSNIQPVVASTPSSTSYRYGDIHINVVGNGFDEQQLAQKISNILKKQQYR